MTATEVYEVVRAFVPDVQEVIWTPDGLEIRATHIAGFAPLGGGWHVRRGSGIAGRGNHWAIQSIAATAPGMPAILGPRVDKKGALRAQLRICPGVVCRRCRGTHSLGPMDTSRCSTCAGTGIPRRASDGVTVEARAALGKERADG